MNDHQGEFDRRRALQLLALGAAAAGAPALAQHGGHGSGQAGHGGAHGAAHGAGHGAGHAGMAMDHPMPVSTRLPGPRPKIGMLVYPRMVLLDLIGPQTVFNIAQCDIHLIWKDKMPVLSELGIPIAPTHDFTDAPRDLDVLCVPGGILGTTACMNDPAVLAFVADRGARARYVTSVCTGALVLGAAGLLRGYKATTLWAVMDVLPILGAIPTDDRVVIDRNRMTGGGVTAGIDFGLTLAKELRGEEVARRTQLTIEYAPKPPFDAGTPVGAGADLVSKMRASRVWMDGEARKAAQAAAARFQRA